MPHKKLVKDIVRRYGALCSQASFEKTQKNSLEAIRDSYFFVLLFLIHIIVWLSPLILFLSMAHGILYVYGCSEFRGVSSTAISFYVNAGLCRCVLIIVTDVASTDSR